MALKNAPEELLSEVYDYNETENSKVVYVDPEWVEEWWEENKARKEKEGETEYAHTLDFVNWIRKYHPNGANLVISIIYSKGENNSCN